MAARTRADIANSAIRIFLQQVGTFYDSLRGYQPYKPTKAQWTEVLNFFDNRCCYCDADLTQVRSNGDHLIAMNKTQRGLHAWGNVVPSCDTCNANKQHKDWRLFLGDQAPMAKLDERVQKIEAFLAHYHYQPNLELEDIVNNLYEDVGEVAMTLINLRYKQAEKVIQRIQSEEAIIK
jgi:hypothetical protein